MQIPQIRRVGAGLAGLALAAVLGAGAAHADPREIPSVTRNIAAPRRVEIPASAPPAAVQERSARPAERVRPQLAPPRSGRKAPAAPDRKASALPPTVPLPAGSLDLRILRQRQLADKETGGTTATSAETDAVARGNEVLLTGNRFAAFSTDAGRSFRPIDPSVFFAGPGDPRLCCGQAVEFDPALDLMVWLLQSERRDGSNLLRIAVSQGPDIRARVWMVYDLPPQLVAPGVQNETLEESNLALSRRFLYITTNLVSDHQEFTREVVLRWPLEKLARYQAFSFDMFTDAPRSPLRAVRGAGDVMYWGATLADSSLRLYTWPEAEAAARAEEIEVEPWESHFFKVPGPDGRDWLETVDTRVTAGWLAGGVLGFAWTAGADASHPLPHVRVAMIDAATRQVVAQPHLWSDRVAYAYPDAAPSLRGRIGISVAFGGKTAAPSHAIGWLEPAVESEGSKAPARWVLHTLRTGTHGPGDGAWGDSVSIRAHPREPATWIATGSTLQGGSRGEDAEILYVHFGV